MRDLWTRATGRKDFVPTRYSKLCSLHFVESDFVEERRDSNAARRRKRLSMEMQRRYLKRDAVPSIFTESSADRSVDLLIADAVRRCLSTSRVDRKTVKLESAASDAEDSFPPPLTLEQIEVELMTQAALLPRGFRLELVDGFLFVYRLHAVDGVPEVQASVTVRPDLTILLAVNHKHVPVVRYRDLLPCSSLRTVTQLLNVITRLDVWCNETGDDVQPRPTELGATL